MTPVTITRQEAAAKIRAQHAAQLLPAQNGLDGTYYAIKADKVIRCAIGCLFTPEDAQALQEIDSDHPVPGIKGYPLADELIDASLLIVDDRDWFAAVQLYHDQWACRADLPGCEAKFLALL